MSRLISLTSCFFFKHTATTEIYTLSLHDALPIWHLEHATRLAAKQWQQYGEALLWLKEIRQAAGATRSEEHTSELQSRPHLVCRLLLEKKKNILEDVKAHLSHLRLAPHSQRQPAD